MYKQASYTKYQKKVIKFLSETLGVHTPFSYERAQNNHLKVLIEGVSRPLYTGSTPSDAKAINNFMAEVKREVALSHQKKADELSSCSKLPISNPVQQSLDKTIQNCLKSLRMRTDTMKLREEELVLATESLDGIKEYRLNEIKNAIMLAKQAQKATVYLKPKEMKNLELKILEHVDFWMPNLAYYASLIDSKKESSFKEEPLSMDMEPQQESVDTNIVKLQEVIKPDMRKEQTNTKTRKENKASAKSVKIKMDATTELMSMSVSKRIDLLRLLTRSEALQLIDEINQALSINRERDIMEVVSMIKEKGLQIEDILPKMEIA